MTDTIKLYLDEQEILKKYQAEDPALVTSQRLYDYDEILKHIGIDIDFGYLPQGYLNLYPQDFVVEELGEENNLSTIEPGGFKIPEEKQSGQATLYAELVKVGLSTLEAVGNLTKALGAPAGSVGYGGIKDKVAVTSQKVSLRNIDFKKLDELHVPGLFLKNFFWGKGVMEKGRISGNQFTILVRTATTLGDGWLKGSLAKVEDGFYNFYYLQRFGSPRLLSHQLGELILQKNYEGTIETFLTQIGVQNVPLITQIRQQVKESFGDWVKLEALFNALPYTFRLELEIVKYLKPNPQDFLGALKNIKDQTTLWVYAYASYLFNLTLSKLINEGRGLPKTLPLLLNPEAAAIENYKLYLNQAKINDLKSALSPFPGLFLNKKNTALTKMPVKIIQAKIINNGVMIAFQLPTGAYATTFLAHLFSLYRGLPLPEWLANREKYDTKKILNLGSIAETEKILGDYIFTPLDPKISLEV